MFDIPANWRAFLLWAIVTIVVAVAANVATPWFQRWGGTCLRVTMRAAALGKQSIVDSYFVQAAYRPHFSALTSLLYFGISGSLAYGIFAYGLAPMMGLTREQFQRLIDTQAACTWPQFLMFRILRCAPNTTMLRVLAVFSSGFFLLTCSILLIRYRVVRSIIDGFDQALTALLPSISQDEERALRSQFALMSGQDDYREIKAQLVKLATRGGIQLPRSIL